MIPSDVYVLLPTCNRAKGLERALASLNDTAPDAHLIVATDPGDARAREICWQWNAQAITTPADYCGAHKAWNLALAAAPKTAKAFVLGADDVVFESGWLDEALKVLDEMLNDSGFVGLNDGLVHVHKGFPFFTHYLMTRDFIIKYNGGVIAFECYRHYCTDIESSARALNANKLALAPRAKIRHVWLGDRFDADFTYQVVKPYAKAMDALLEERRGWGFPDDFPPMITE